MEEKKVQSGEDTTIRLRTEGKRKPPSPQIEDIIERKWVPVQGQFMTSVEKRQGEKAGMGNSLSRTGS